MCLTIQLRQAFGFPRSNPIVLLSPYIIEFASTFENKAETLNEISSYRLLYHQANIEKEAEICACVNVLHTHPHTNINLPNVHDKLNLPYLYLFR